MDPKLKEEIEQLINAEIKANNLKLVKKEDLKVTVRAEIMTVIDELFTLFKTPFTKLFSG